MLKMYVMHQSKRWEDFVPLVEFSYNNGYKESLKMCSFEALYDYECNTPINWNDSVNRVFLGLDTLKEME